MTSLRRRLVITLLTSVLLGGVVSVTGLYWQSLDELDEMFDDRLRAIGDNLTPQALAAREPGKSEETEDEIVVQLWRRDGSLAYASNADERAPIPTATGLATLQGHERWRSYSRATAEGGWLQVAQEIGARHEMAAATSLRLLLPLFVVLPFLALFTSWGISRQLRPLRALSEQLQRSGPQKQLHVEIDDAPRELAPVIGALNDLLARQAAAALQQQAFLADAAHELRTPLTVVGLQVQRAQQALNEQDRDDALSALRSGVDRATRLVTQLLALARSEPARSEDRPAAPVDLDGLIKSVLAELFPLASQKRIDLGLVVSEPCVVEADGEGLRSLVINLVDNAIRHTPSGGRIDVSLSVAGTLATLLVSDTGCGIPPQRRQAVFERFVRDGSADSSGTGLGLAIVRQVVERNGGTIALEDGASGVGLTVRVVLRLKSGTA